MVNKLLLLLLIIDLDDTGIYLCEVVSVANNQIKASLAFDVTGKVKECNMTNNIDIILSGKISNL